MIWPHRFSASPTIVVMPQLLRNVTRLRIAADVKAAHHRGQAVGDELQGEVAAARDTDWTARRPAR